MFTWRVAQTAFRAYTTCGLRENALNFFHQLWEESRARTVTFLVTLGRMNLAPYHKAFGTFSKGMHWRTCPPHNGLSCTKCFSNLYNVQFERKSLWKFFCQLRPAQLLFQLPCAGWMWPTTRKPFGTFSRCMRWRTHPPHYGYYSCYCFLCQWATVTSQYEKLITR